MRLRYPSAPGAPGRRPRPATLAALAAAALVTGVLAAPATPASAASPSVACACARVDTPGVMHCMALRRTDLATYRAQYGLPACTTANGCFQKVNQNGATSPLPKADSGWDGPTGLGTPHGTAAFAAGSSGGVSVTNPGGQTSAVGASVSLALSASGGGGSYGWTASGLPAGLSIGASSGVVAGSPTTAGTYSVTVTTSGGGCTPAQLLGNPGFETGSASPWTSTSGVVNASSSSGETSHSGSYLAWLDGYGRSHTDTLSQSVAVPSGCGSVTLSFWLKIDSSETTSSTAYDTLTVKVGSTTLATYSNLDEAGYTQKSFNLGGYAGQPVTITFTGVEDSSLQTSFVIDDTALTVS